MVTHVILILLIGFTPLSITIFIFVLLFHAIPSHKRKALFFISHTKNSIFVRLNTYKNWLTFSGETDSSGQFW